jgi:hypothetical protein
MRTVRHLIPLLALAACVAVPAHADSTGKLDTLRFFQTPSKRISCLITNHVNLRCDGPDKHPGPRPKHNCIGDFGGAFGLSSKGHAERICVSDAARTDHEKTLGYGKSVHDGAFTCLSTTRALYCHNLSHHGFKISVQDSHLF